jgi:predicted phosphodiesterase
MNIQLLSDLHLEANPGYVPQPAPGADVLVLAGDVGSYQRRAHGGRMPEPDWGLRRFSPLPQHAAWPVPVLFVPGNHEYDALDFDAARHQLRHTCERLGLVWLDQEVHTLQGVRFVGTTLWSDYEALVSANTPVAQQERQRQKAYKAANFYLSKMATWRHGRLFDAEAMRLEALACQAWLDGALQQPHSGPTVVVTHFAPSLRSADPRYGLTPGTAGFCNSLDPWLARADLWLHGHLHCAHDYRVGRCRVVANPLGYASKRVGVCRATLER